MVLVICIVSIASYNFLTFKPPETKDYGPSLNYKCHVVNTQEYIEYRQKYGYQFLNETFIKPIRYIVTMGVVVPLFPNCDD